jgi:hypothetical protein
MKTKIKLIFIATLCLCNTLSGQITEAEAKLRTQNTDTIQGWKTGGVVAFTIAQTSLTNWAAGGQNAFAVNGLFSIFANYKKGENVWDNSLDVGYGILKQESNTDYMKTDDRFDILSKYGRKAFTNLYYAGLLNFKTQMAIGKDYKKDTAKISNFLAPAYVLAALGMDYKPSSYFSAFVGSLTGKLTMVYDQQLADKGAFGVDAATYDLLGNRVQKGKNVRTEFGGYARVIFSKNDFRQQLLRNVAFTTKIDLFSNYLKKPENIDVSWESQLAFKVNKYLTVNVNTHLLYDADVRFAVDNNKDGITDGTQTRVQFKEILGVGFQYKF